MIELDDIDATEYARGQASADVWWNASAPTPSVAMERHEELEELAIEAVGDGDMARYSYLLGAIDRFATKLEG